MILKLTDGQRHLKQYFHLAAIALSLAWPGASQPVTASERLAAWFTEPPMQYRSRPLYWLNAPLEPAALREQIQAMRDQCGFGGFAPLTLRTAQPDYLTEGFFERYAPMLETAQKLGLKIIFYDDINFHYYGHGRDGFKLVTSAAFTYDRPVTAVEIYGNYPDNSVDNAMLYRGEDHEMERGSMDLVGDKQGRKGSVPPQVR